MQKKFRDLINQANSHRSTGPRTAEGKKRSALNAFKHGLSGNHLVMQQHEFAAYQELSKNMTRDLKPETEPEKQIARKITDLNFRINRITAIENNMLNIDMTYHAPALEEDDAIAAMMGQAQAWKNDAHSFEILGRYEARLSKQLLQYQKELTRMQAERALLSRDRQGVVGAETTDSAPLNPESASFGTTPPAYVMSAESPALATSVAISQPAPPAVLIPKLASFGKPQPPPDRLRVPQAA